ncbi:activase [Myxococcota bacterium]|nr:activase [Myxococcota bacterium]MBU1380122.1 activase [Myxococcota bacterium]MBU1497140.1 activase [Myxococcota bacterium]
MYTLGINIGSASIKMVLMKNGDIEWFVVKPHEGNFSRTLEKMIREQHIPDGTRCIVTGTEGRYLLNIASVVESVCIEKAVHYLGEKVDAIVSLGGEDFVTYTLDSDGKIVNNFSGNKCASGTGEFFKQQLGRMNMPLDIVNDIKDDLTVHPLSARCSVFMKSDCTHKLNKGEATKDEIVVSLSHVMATKVYDFLSKARLDRGRVLLFGGVTINKHLVRYLREMLPEIEFIIPPQAPWFEAFGAAIVAKSAGSTFPDYEHLFKSQDIGFGRFKSLKTADGKVNYIPSKMTKAVPGRKYILGIDGGSTTTKVTLIDFETDEIVASHYGRTHGDPVRALKNCLIEVKKQLAETLGNEAPEIVLAATTGSSREILGVFIETGAVYNEIIAHSVGTTYFDKDIDTIFEIGGQDAKYVFLRNGVPIDYAMNEACSAGTGSFLEESASGDLNIASAKEIGEIAVESSAPLKFGEQCSAFINSDIRKAIQLGATREDITAGVITSVVSNYLNRVVGNRSIGTKIALQGGVALNKAVCLAFSMLLDRQVTVPPNPELLGCFGVGILAKQKLEAGLIDIGDFNIEKILNTEIVYEKEFKCRACDNLCPIKVLLVNGTRYMFGGRCNKYANMRKKKNLDENNIFNYIDIRQRMLFQDFAAIGELPQNSKTVGIPRAFSVYSLYPLYSWFFHGLGLKPVLSEEIPHEGVARTESSYCFPAEIAHGAVYDIISRNTDYIFIPHFRDMPSYENHGNSNFCPITQSLPYYIRKAFPQINENKWLSPVITFNYGKEKAEESFLEMGRNLGFSDDIVRKSFDKAWEKQNGFLKAIQDEGKVALKKAREAGHPVIALLGRPYNAFTKDANMGIPLKFTSRGCSVIPYDMLPVEGEEIFDNMYWYYGQQDMKASAFLRNEPNIFITFITNFSCAPDSFMLHYVKWMMGTKPFLILELDSHSADAGVDTRIEAFLDIIEGYRSKFRPDTEERYDNGLRFINNGKEKIHLRNEKTGEKIQVFGNQRVKMLFSNMGQLSTELLSSVVRGIGINAEGMPLPDVYALQFARNYMSGKECLPSQLVLGSALTYFASEKYHSDEIYLLFVPTTTGPCRTGQYYIFYENLFKDLKFPNVVIFTLDSDNSYNELGPDFSRRVWWAIVIADYMKDIETTLRTCAADPKQALDKYDTLWRRLIAYTDDVQRMLKVLEEIATELRRIPLRRKMEETPKVLVVGEIYVRRDDFAVDELVGRFASKGIIAKISGITEWIYYCDYYRKHELVKKFKLVSWKKKLFSPQLKELFMWEVEKTYKHYVEGRVKKILKPTGLLPETPHNMEEIMANANRFFVSDELYSEISISSGAASTAMLHDYSGIVNISPFACLIGRVIEGIYTPWARERKLPVISVEIDGNVLPPGIINRLDIFMLNVLRLRQEKDTAEFVESPEGNKSDTDRRKRIIN